MQLNKLLLLFQMVLPLLIPLPLFSQWWRTSHYLLPLPLLPRSR